MASVLVVGGAGYIGSCVTAHLLDRGDQVWVLDDLSTGHRSLIPDSVLAAGRFTESRAGDRTVVESLLKSEHFDAVFHFAAKTIVSESVKFPELYRENNVEQTRLLLDAMIAAKVKRFVFSSTAAVYGDPGSNEISEDLARTPLNPYGETKLEVELMLQQYAESHSLRSIALRYFNAAGADSKLRAGECHHPETHLIPNVLSAALESSEVLVFGDDYPTRDGTCLRDYIHVEDLAEAHAAACDRMLSEQGSYGGFEAFNLGSELGFTVSEVISTAERITGKKIKKKVQARRSGDPARLVAVAKKAQSQLEFNPSKSTLEKIISTALAWEEKKRVPKKAVFLDRDGTLNFDPGYLSDSSALKLLPGVVDGLRELQAAGYLLIVVSNQSGIAREKITYDQLHRIHEKMDRILGEKGVRIHHYALCYHHPDTDCECRKPKPKLILDTAALYSIDLTGSFMVGDKVTDLEAGKRAGLKHSFLVGTGYGAEEMKSLPDSHGIYFQTFREIANEITRFS